MRSKSLESTLEEEMPQRMSDENIRKDDQFQPTFYDKLNYILSRIVYHPAVRFFYS